jgi:hypothetical protein
MFRDGVNHDLWTDTWKPHPHGGRATAAKAGGGGGLLLLVLLAGGIWLNSGEDAPAEPHPAPGASAWTADMMTGMAAKAWAGVAEDVTCGQLTADHGATTTCDYTDTATGDRITTAGTAFWNANTEQWEFQFDADPRGR